MGRFDGKVAVVTGGAQGIGEAIARRLASEGATVAILDIQQDKARAVADDIQARGARAIAVEMDVTDRQDVRRAVKEVEAKLEKIDVLINNVGRNKLSPLIDLPDDLCDRLLSVNLRGPITVTQAVLGGMVRRNSGKIVNIASEAGRVGSPGDPIYSASKGGIIALTKTLAQELARYGILVNCVAPGPIETELMAATHADNPKRGEAMVRRIPLRRPGKPEEVAAVVAFFASDDASYITGQTLSVSGGLTMM